VRRLLTPSLTVALLCVTAACGSSAKHATSTTGSTTTTTVGGVVAPTTIAGEETTTPPTTAAGGATVDLNLHAKGTINGTDFDGPVVGSQLLCTAAGTGDYVHVNWAGTIVIKGQGEQIAGDMDLKIPSTVFPSGGTASLELAGDYQHRVGATSGTATAGAKDGTINAEYAAGSDTAALQGTWRCT
jgi:hypothetical protein